MIDTLILLNFALGLAIGALIGAVINLARRKMEEEE